MDIICNQCGKFLFSTEKKSIGAAGAEAQERGFVFKMPFLFTDKYDALFFCDHKCGSKFYKLNIPKNAEAENKLKKLQENIPKFSKETADELSKFQKLLVKIKKDGNKIRNILF